MGAGCLVATRVMKLRFSGNSDEAAEGLGLPLEVAAMLWEDYNSFPACIPYPCQGYKNCE